MTGCYPRTLVNNPRILMPEEPNTQTEESPSEEKRELSYGEKLAGVDFNPSENMNVATIKQISARFIDTLHNLRESTDNGELKRMYAAAITDAQKAQMLAVKAATWKY